MNGKKIDHESTKNNKSLNEEERKSMTLEEKTSLHRQDGKYELPEITEDMLCPSCAHKTVKLTRTIYHLPDGDDIIILLLECNNCNYHKADTIPLASAFQPGTYYLTVDDGDLTHKIFRGMTGTLEIPELGVEIDRGPAASFHLTNVEGILQQIERTINIIIRDVPKNSQESMNANMILNQLHQCQEGKMVFTVILKDPEGGSYISTTNPNKLKFVKFS